ncbi:UNVERIFIED_CONTAM: hypothetical protein Sangu_3057500 [Sesamum angustifolium]|uniref:Uncharacterized protein n=1 Tax=Sesamum angustifolium TaxID=2727405 RepID=A0AAW2KDL2_9LAMI
MPLVLVEEASTSKAKGNVAGRKKRKKDETSSIAASTSSAPIKARWGQRKVEKGSSVKDFE